MVQDCFSTWGSTGICAEDRQQEHIEVCSRHTGQLLMPPALFLGWLDNLFWGDKSGTSHDCVMITPLHFCTPQFVCGHVSTFYLFFFPSFGKLCYPQWAYPKCSLMFNILGTHLQRDSLMAWPLAAHELPYSVTVIHDSCLFTQRNVCLSVHRGGAMQTDVRQVPSFLGQLRTRYLDTDTSKGNTFEVHWNIRRPWKITTFTLSPCNFSGHRFPLQRSKNLLINWNTLA